MISPCFEYSLRVPRLPQAAVVAGECPSEVASFDGKVVGDGIVNGHVETVTPDAALPLLKDAAGYTPGMKFDVHRWRLI